MIQRVEDIRREVRWQQRVIETLEHKTEVMDRAIHRLGKCEEGSLSRLWCALYPEDDGPLQPPALRELVKRWAATRPVVRPFTVWSVAGRRGDYTKGHETSCYVCGNRYRTKTCQSSNVNACEVESFVVEHVREYLKDTAHFETYARELCNAVNNATADVSEEKRELAEVEAKIANGVNSIVSGFTFPELQDEIDRLRTRKSELEEVICAAQKNIKLAPEDIVRKLKQAAEDIGDPSKLKEVIQMVVIKIYAQPDGSFSVLLGVHMDGSPGRV